MRALEFRDLLELKSALANSAAYDFLDHFSDLVYRPNQFFLKAKLFRLFSYDRCLSHSRENYEATKRWMRITTTLTKYESHACIKYHNFDRHKNILDIGGYSGEFVLQICRKYPAIQATVFDLPLVCEIGQEHIQHEPEASREPIAVTRESLLYSMIPFLLFSHSFRPPIFYEKQLEGLDFQNIKVTRICLDTQFFIITATKKI